MELTNRIAVFANVKISVTKAAEGRLSAQIK